MSMTKDVPEIRFMGFSESWSHKTIDDLINEEVIYPPKDGNHGGIHPKATDYVEYGIPFIMANNIRGGEIHYGGCYHISLQQAQTLQKGFAKTGDVLLTHKGTVGEVAIIGRIEFPYLMLTPQVTYYRICDTSKLDTYFLATAFRSNSFQKPLKEEAGGGTRAYIGITAQKGLELSIPQNIEEQKELGNYFQKLDTLINQHQQKHDKLSNLKKAMLEKMFPKAGETVPEIRFDGFSGNWTTTSLSKIAHVIDPHPSHRAPDAVANGVPFIGIGDVAENGHVDFKNVRIVPYHIYGEHRQRYQVEVGDFAYGRVASIGKIIDLSSNVDREYTYSPTMAIVKPVTLYSPYLKGYMNTSVFKGRVDNKTTGSTRKSLGVQDFRELPVCFPEQQEEQIKIGDYFQKLGLLINQHKHQITKLKNIKQACLDKMFV